MNEDERLSRRAEMLAERRPTDLPVLYHYTDAAGLLGILTGRSIRLSASTSMNDRTEGAWLWRELYDGRDPPRRGAFEPLMIPTDDLRQALLLLGLASGQIAYLACFSEADDMLSQWRAYGDDGRGVAIGFDLNDGRASVVDGPPTTNAAGDFGCTVNGVTYSTEFMRSLNLKVDSAVAAGIESDEWFNVQMLLTRVRWLAKNPAFAEEREWRIVSLPMTFNSDIGGGQTSVGEIGDRQWRTTGDGQLVSYYDLPFEPSAAVSIRLGPQCRFERDELERFLLGHGYSNVTIERSAATYRS